MRDGHAGRGPWALFALAVACAGTSAPRLTVVGSARTIPRPQPLPRELPPPLPGLPAGVRAERYTVELTVDPRQDTFSGLMEVELTLAERTQQLWLLGRGMRVRGASVSARGSTRPAHAVHQGEEGLGFLLERPVGPGPVKLRVAWEARASAPGAPGLLRREEAGRWYASTSLRPGEARLVPTLDGPSLTVPWQLTLRMPAGDRAFTEWPVLSEEVGPDGLRTVRLRPATLSGEALSFAVGPADRAPAPRRSAA